MYTVDRMNMHRPAQDSVQSLAAALEHGDVRLLVLHGNPDSYRDLIEARIGADRIRVCRRYRDLAPLLDEFQPNMLLSFKVAGDPDAYPADVVTGSESLRWVHVGGAGIDHLGIWDPARLTVTNSSGIHRDLMSQYAIAAMVMFTQHFPLYARQQRERIWQRRDCQNLRGRTAVVVGFGNIGQAIGTAARAFGMRVIGVRTTPEPSDAADEVWPVSRLSDAAAEADYFILCLPLTDRTRGSIDAGIIGALKPGAVMINIARGGIVDEAALLEALDGDRIKGAVMDVFATEPLPEESPFWDHPKVILTPHSSSDATGWERDVAEIYCQNVGRLLEGKAMINIVDPSRGY